MSILPHRLLFLSQKVMQLCALGGVGGHYTPISFCNCTLWESAERERILAEVGQQELSMMSWSEKQQAALQGGRAFWLKNCAYLPLFLAGCTGHRFLDCHSSPRESKLGVSAAASR